MRFTLRQGSLPLIAFAFITGGLTQKAVGQSLVPCQPPNAGEYLLMVINSTPETPVQLQQTLPNTLAATTCDYLGRSVTRVSGFTSSEVANAWAQYFNDLGGLQAFVARPANANSPVAPSPNLPVAQTPIPANSYNPQPLGSGYAVLVNYFNRPEVAIEVQQLLSTSVGLVSYEQQPYLLATYTTDPNVATRLFRTLSDRSFVSLIVDSSKAILLTPTVARP